MSNDFTTVLYISGLDFFYFCYTNSDKDFLKIMINVQTQHNNSLKLLNLKDSFRLVEVEVEGR